MDYVPTLPKNYDVLVIGGGNAALCAAIAANEGGASVLLVEKSPKVFRGGNSRHTRNIRYTHDTPTPEKNSWLTGPYPQEECFQDILKVTGGDTNEEMARLCIEQSHDIGQWMVEHGAMFQPAMRATLHLGRTNSFFLGGGRGLVNGYYHYAEKHGVEIMYETYVTELVMDGNKFKYAMLQTPQGPMRVNARSAIAGAGGSQANPNFLAKHWGEAAFNFRVRGCPYDTGEILQMLLDNGVDSVGDPTQGHMVAIDARAPRVDAGICTRLDCVPYGIVVNKHCKRFHDEGEEFWPKRYAVWGRFVAQEDGQIGYCLIDSKSINLFMPSVFPPTVTNSLDEMAQKLGLDAAALKATVDEFNKACQPGNFDPEEKDGVHTEGIEPAKTNWARPIDTPPFYGYQLAPGITFTYQGAKVDKTARCVLKDGTSCENMFACGEIMSGNILGKGYMAGFGMTIGTVFGRIAGTEAAKYVKG